MAYGVLNAAEDFGLSVPRDVALVGFDDDAPSAHAHPPLTTIRQPYFEMGQRGIELLLSMLDTPDVPLTPSAPGGEGEETLSAATQPVRIQLPTSLIVRESCGATYQSSVAPSSDPSTL